MKIEYTTTPESSDISFLMRKIDEETPEFGAASSFAFFMRNNEGNIIAGCNGSLVFSAIYTDQLWVHPSHRKQGLGQQLMGQVHALGRKTGCTMATVATMCFQEAQPFYEKLGYQVIFERAGHTKNSKCIFLKMKL